MTTALEGPENPSLNIRGLRDFLRCLIRPVLGGFVGQEKNHPPVFRTTTSVQYVIDAKQYKNHCATRALVSSKFFDFSSNYTKWVYPY